MFIRLTIFPGSSQMLQRHRPRKWKLKLIKYPATRQQQTAKMHLVKEFEVFFHFSCHKKYVQVLHVRLIQISHQLCSIYGQRCVEKGNNLSWWCLQNFTGKSCAFQTETREGSSFFYSFLFFFCQSWSILRFGSSFLPHPCDYKPGVSFILSTSSIFQYFLTPHYLPYSTAC